MPSDIYIPQPNEFYVYIYWNPLKNNQPFYVGKGKGTSAFSHLQYAKDDNPHKYRTIQRIKKAGLRPKITCAWNGPDEAKAHWIERFLIAMWGRRWDKRGILTNITKGGNVAVMNLRKQHVNYLLLRLLVNERVRTIPCTGRNTHWILG